MLNTFAINLFIYLLFVVHSLFRIGIVFFDYHAAKYNVSAQTMRVFLQNLKFPLSIYQLNEVTSFFSESNPDEIHIASKGTRRLLITVYVVIIFLAIGFNLYDIAYSSGIDRWHSSFWLFIKVLTILALRTWRFGHTLEAIQNQSKLQYDT